MEIDKKLSEKNIQEVLRNNFFKLMPTFYEMQSSFLSGVYKRYGDLEGGHIVLCFARNLHLAVLRKRENNINLDISLDKFWDNHKNVDQSHQKIISIAQKTGLPKETARRKIIYLVKNKHIKKGEKNKLYWEPVSELKETYINIIRDQIKSLSKFIFEQAKFLGIPIQFSKIEKELLNNYSYYWHHYLNVQLQYMKFWQMRLKDLEMLLIGLQTTIQTINFLSSKMPNDFDNFSLNEVPIEIDIKNANISATSVAEITGIPRATCIRKLEKYVRMKVLQKDKVNKRYYLSKSLENQILLSNEGIQNTTNIFGQFSSVLLRSIAK